MRTDVKIGIAGGLVLVVGVVAYMVINSGSPDSPESGTLTGLHGSSQGGGGGVDLGSGNPDKNINLFPSDLNLITPDINAGSNTTGAGAGGDAIAGDTIASVGGGDTGIAAPVAGTGSTPVVTPITVLSDGGPINTEPAGSALLPGGGDDSSIGPIDLSSPTNAPYPDSAGGVTGGVDSAVAGAGRTHVIRASDKLWDVAGTYYGNGKHWSHLVASNPGLNPTALPIGKIINIPPLPVSLNGSGYSGAATPDPVTAAGENVYVVREGDNGMWGISESQYGHGKYFTAIAKRNPLVDSAQLKIGQKLILPSIEQAKVLSGSTGGVGVGGTSRVAEPDPVAVDGEKIYVVREGDSGMWGISKSQYGDGKYLPAIANRNLGVNPSRLSIGQKIILPSLEQAKAFRNGSSTRPPVSDPDTFAPSPVRTPRPAPSGGDGEPDFS